MISLLIVDDHPLVRTGLRALAEGDSGLCVVGEAGDGQTALELAVQLAPDVVLMDLSMPGMDGVQATRELHAVRPATAVVVLTSFPDQERVSAALAAGAVGYLLKDSDHDTLLRAVHAAAEGYAPIDPRVARALLPPADERRPSGGTAEPGEPEMPLSHRESEVLKLVAKGLANKQIARSLGISESTVKAHIGNIFRAIGVADRTSAAMWARNNDLV